MKYGVRGTTITGIAIELSQLVVTESGQTLGDYEPSSTDTIQVNLLGTKDEQFTPTYEGNVLYIGRWTPTIQGTYSVEVLIRQESGLRLRSLQKEQFCIVDCADDVPSGGELINDTSVVTLESFVFVNNNIVVDLDNATADTYTDALSAFNDGKAVFGTYNGNMLQMTGKTTSGVSMLYFGGYADSNCIMVNLYADGTTTPSTINLPTMATCTIVDLDNPTAEQFVSATTMHNFGKVLIGAYNGNFLPLLWSTDDNMGFGLGCNGYSLLINFNSDGTIDVTEKNMQEALTFDSYPSNGSTNPVTSGGVAWRTNLLQSKINEIVQIIPTQATSSNQLADKYYVGGMDDKIMTALGNALGFTYTKDDDGNYTITMNQ